MAKGRREALLYLARVFRRLSEEVADPGARRSSSPQRVDDRRSAWPWRSPLPSTSPSRRTNQAHPAPRVRGTSTRGWAPRAADGRRDRRDRRATLPPRWPPTPSCSRKRVPPGAIDASYITSRRRSSTWLARAGPDRVVARGSHVAQTVRRVQRLVAARGIDLLFIDGDHSYGGGTDTSLMRRSSLMADLSSS